MSSRALSAWLLAGAVLLCAQGAHAMEIEVFALKHRTASDLIPVLRPLVPEPGTVTGMDSRLIVRGTDETLRQIRAAIRELDRPLRRLRITVRQDVDSNAAVRQQALGGAYRSGELHASAGDPGRSDSGVVVIGRGDGATVRYRGHRTHDRDELASTQFVQTVEGRPAFIRIGQSVPVADRTLILYGPSATVQDTIRYRDVTTGFHVIPRVTGDDTVTLAISPHLDRLRPARGHAIDVQGVVTTISGRLGEWMEVGGLVRNATAEDRHTLSSTRRRDARHHRILLRIDEIR